MGSLFKRGARRSSIFFESVPKQAVTITWTVIVIVLHNWHNCPECDTTANGVVTQFALYNQWCVFWHGDCMYYSNNRHKAEKGALLGD